MDMHWYRAISIRIFIKINCNPCTPPYTTSLHTRLTAILQCLDGPWKRAWRNMHCNRSVAQ